MAHQLGNAMHVNVMGAFEFCAILFLPVGFGHDEIARQPGTAFNIAFRAEQRRGKKRAWSDVH